MLRPVAGAVLAGLLWLSPTQAAGPVDQTAAIQIFEIPHMDEVARGARVNYKFERKVNLTSYPAGSYDDKIHVDVTKVEADGKRNVALQVFSGARAKGLWEETGMTGNPLLGWYLDNCVNQFRAIAGGERDLLKNTFKVAIRERAKYENVKVDWKGKQVEAMKVTISPYTTSREKKKMQGYENSYFTLLFSPDVPGYFIELSSHFESSDKRSPMIEEKIILVDVAEQGQ